MQLTKKRILQALKLPSNPFSEDKTKKAKRTTKQTRTSHKHKKITNGNSNKTKNGKSNKPKTRLGGKKGKRALAPLCDTCLNVTNDKPSKFFAKTNERWQDFPHHIPVLGRTEGGQCVDLDIGTKYANRLVYYFAAAPASIAHGTKPAEYPHGYLPMTNVGLQHLDRSGKCTLRLDCPQVYKDKVPGAKKGDKMRQGYMNHVHVLVASKDMSGWEDVIFTQNVVCQISRAQFKYHAEKRDRMIINAIDPKYNLDGTHANIGYKDAAAMSANKLRELVQELAPKKLKRGLDTPLLVYCYNPTCPAAKKLMDSLYTAGFYNILYFPGGWLSGKGRY